MDAVSTFSGPLMLLGAVAIDLVFGDPPNAFHPVAWMGRFIAWLMKAPVHGRAKGFQVVYGLVVVLVTVGCFGGAAIVILALARGVNEILYIVIGSVLLKISFSIRGLWSAGARVRNQINSKSLPEARSSVKALVGRDTAGLDDGQVISAVVESVAENACDSFVAPLLFFAFLGVPGAVCYRAINTLDNSIGFRGRYEYLGKVAARLDDVANFIPARITAFFFVASAWFARRNWRKAWRIMLRDRRKTASPNGGWTMSAMAGALEVRLEKPGHYQLGDPGRQLTVSLISASLIIMAITTVMAIGLSAVISASLYAS